MNNWQTVALGDVCTLLNGRAYKKNELLSEGKYPVLRVGNFFSNRKWYYSDLELEENKYCDNGDLLYAWSASFGPRIWEGEKVIYHYHIWKTKLDEKRINKRFLYYWFDWDTNQIKSDHGAGSTMIHVTKSSMEKRKLRLPPLPEQKRIVAILDKAFKGIDTAIANTEKNLANARELFESYINTIFNDAQDKWPNKTLDDISEVKGGKRLPKGYKPQTEKTAYPYIRVADFDNSGGVCLDDLRYISKEVHNSIKRYTISSNDVFITIVGATIGKSGIVPDVLDGANLTENACKLVLKSSALKKFIYYFTLSKSFYDQVGLNTRVAAQPKLALIRIKTIKLGIPPINIQSSLCEKLDKVFIELNRLEYIYQQKLAALSELKQSILNKAFSGELTTIRDDELRTEEVA